MPDSLLESTMMDIGAIAVGQSAGRPLFALRSTGATPSDQVSTQKVITSFQ